MDAYVTLLSTESFFEAVLVLNQSLKNVNSEYPLVCMVTNNLNGKITKIPKTEGLEEAMYYVNKYKKQKEKQNGSKEN